MFKGLAVLIFLLLGVAVQGQTVSIQANVPTALESGSVPGQFRVFTFFTVVSPDITVNYTVSGTANPGGDYTALSGTITLSGIVAGTSENFIDVTGIVDDANIEGDETVIVTLTSASGLGSIAPPPNNTATVTIKDNDGATVAFSSAAGSGPENAGTGIPTLLVNGTVVNPTTVSLTTGGTATAADYALASPTITIPAGIYTNGTIPLGLTITGDAVVEPNETVVLSLTSPTGDAILAPPTTTTYTIQNDDLVTIRIDDPPSVPEGNSNVQTLTFTVGIDQADPTAQVRVNYTISGGNENGTSNTLTFLDGTTVLTQTIDVTTNGDLVLEPDEPVTVTLSNPSANAVLAPNPDNVGTSSFTNDDTASLSIADATVAEDVAGGNMVFTVTLNNAVSGGTTV
ncbi:hypothetical protein K8352_11700, partial [Flavobacteriaceae bacterium F89]